MKKGLRFYTLYCGGDFSMPVVAHTAKEAKKVGGEAFMNEEDCTWTEICVNYHPGIKVPESITKPTRFEGCMEVYPWGVAAFACPYDYELVKHCLFYEECQKIRDLEEATP